MTARVLPAALPIETVTGGTVLARIHWLTTTEPFFGPEPGTPPTHRFHDPERKFRVCFLGENATASFAETFLRDPPLRLIATAEIAKRGLTTFNVVRELRLVKVRDDPQQLSRDLWKHPDRPDGIQYRCRHDNSLLAVALYDRADDGLRVNHSENLLDDHDRLLEWSRRYRFALG